MNLHKNFIINAALCCLLLGVVMWVSTSQVAAQNVIADDNLKAAINAAFTAQGVATPRTSGQAVLESELSNAAFLQLDASGEEITDLDGLQYATNLTHLDLSHNALKDELVVGIDGVTKNKDPSEANSVLRHLSELASLEELYLSNNSIIQIAALRNLKNLTKLAIDRNQISDFSTLVHNAGVGSDNPGMGSGDTIWLGANRFGNAAPIGSGEDIVPVSQFHASNLPSLVNLAGITVHTSFGKVLPLYTGDDPLELALRRAFPNYAVNEFPLAIEPLTDEILGSIKSLDLSYDAVGEEFLEHITLLQYATNLETLILAGQGLGSFGVLNWTDVLAQLTKLKKLDLSGQQYLDDLSFLENLTELTHLDLADNWLIDLRSLANLTELTHLDLSGNTITHEYGMHEIVKLTKLEALDLRNNDIEFIPEEIQRLTNLEVLYFGNTFVDLRGPYLPDRLVGVEGLDAEITGGGSSNPLTRPQLEESIETLQALANRPNKRLITDELIVKSVEFVEPETLLVYGPEASIRVKVTLNSFAGYKHSSAAFREGRPYLKMSVDREVVIPDGTGNPLHPAEWVLPDVLEFSDDYEPPAANERYLLDDDPDLVLGQGFQFYPFSFNDNDHERYLELQNIKVELPEEVLVDVGEEMEFLYVLEPGANPSEIFVYECNASPFVHFYPEIDVFSLSGPITSADYEYDGLYVGRDIFYLRHPWFSNLPSLSKPFVLTGPTVQMSRASGETGTATGEKFDVEITFSGPLSEASAAALASKISFGDVAGVSVDSLTRPGPPTAYEPETWTLSVAVAAGVSGDVTVTLDPEGLLDAASPGNAVVATGSTLSITVPVNRPGESVPDTEPVTVGSSLEFSIVFEEDGVTYEGTEKPYITIYVGEQEQANERHAVWARERDVNSTEVTFEYQIGVGDIASEVSLKPEEGIAIPQGTTFVSETVRIVGKDLPASGPGEAPPPPTQQSGGGGPDPGQPAAGSPPITTAAERTRVSLTTAFARPTVLKRSVQILGIVYLPPETEETKADASGVPRSPVVFNELGNGSGDSNDWLEFRNVTGAAVSLKDWELSVVQNGEKKDTSLIVFPDVSVPANGLLLITNSDPTADGNRLAGGDNAATSAVETKGSSHLYLVNSGLALPDDGKFLLILRKSKEKLGKDEAFVDVAGGGGSDTDAFIREQAGEYDTHVWPLQVREAPGADTEDALGSGKVWQRAKADIVGYHKDAWAEAAFTGIGYDRAVSKSAATAGTPGYPNGALKTEASTPKGSITISEVMFDSGGGKLPQWIELYNKSKTEAINLNRWKLELQNVNSEDLVGRPIVTLTLGEKVIQPNQTLLIVSGDARASASARLPADRVYNLFDLHEKNLRIKKQHDTFLSAVGFYLKLSDRNGTKIDEVGNTDGNRRTDDAPSWAFPVSPEEGVRSSLIRRYTKGTSVAEDGMERGGWVLASNVKRFVADKELHWGHADDIGTPGYRAGGPLPVELSSFSVKRTEAGAVVLTWTTESEVDNAGFNLRRSEKRDSGFTLLNPALIAGAGTTGERQAYTFTDTSAKPGVEYYYRIEEVAFDGGPVTLVTRFLPGPVSASNRMLTTFGAVKSRD